MQSTPGDQETLTRFNARLAGSLEIGLRLSADPRSADFRRFADAFARAAPRVKIKTENGREDALPQLRVSSAIRYRAVPLGPELPPFLDCLEWIARGQVPLGKGEKRLLDAIRSPASVDLFVAPRCPHCPAVVRRLLPLAAAGKGIRLTVIDASLFTEAAAAADIRSTPTVVLDGAFRWTGAAPVEEILRVAADGDPAKLGAAALRSLIEEGKADRVAAMMVRARTVFPAFIELLRHEKWPVRLGAMVAFEYLAEAAPRLAARVADPLWERFDEVDDNVKGDILHVLAQSGRPDFIPRLEAVAAGGGGQELREAAAEAAGRLGAAQR